MPPAVADTVVGRAGGRCEVMIFPVCTGGAEHLHHRKISGREHLVENLVHICRACHEWIHGHPAQSYEQGWLVKMAGDPAVVPVSYRGRVVRLGAAGEVLAAERG